MPLPPPPPIFLGPAAAKAAAVAVEYYLPSASLAALLVHVAWRNTPAWIRQDLTFHGNQAKHAEKLSSVILKIQAWLEEAAEQVQPVPHLWASFLLYWQLSSQLYALQQKDDETNASSKENVDSFQIQTPSRETMSRLQSMLQLATCAYYLQDPEWLEEQLRDNFKMDLLQIHSPDRPGLVGYFVAEEQQGPSAETDAVPVLVIGIRGTTSLEELLTDACGKSVVYDPGSATNKDQVSGESLSLQQPSIEVRAKEHDRVVELDATTSFEQIEVVSGHERILDQQQQQPTDCSHVRCHQGILLAAKNLLEHVEHIVREKVLSHPTARLILTGHSLGAAAAALVGLLLRSKYPELLLQPKRLQVYAFAPPPVLDHDSAIAAASYTTSVVVRSDLIARCSVANLRVFLEFLREFSNQVVIPQGMAPTQPKSTARLLRQLSKGVRGTPLWTREKVRQAMKAAEQTVELRHWAHLYVPGKLYYLDYRQPAQESQGGTADPVLLKDLEYSCRELDVTAPELRTIEMSGYQMIGDHTLIALDSAFGTLLEESSV